MNFRTTNARLAFIGRATSIRGVALAEFALRSSEAASALNERPALDDETCGAFAAALDAPVEPGPDLKERFARRPLQER